MFFRLSGGTEENSERISVM